MDHLRHSKLENVRVSDLVGYARNARTHSANQIAQIAAAVRQFGWTNPVLIDEDNVLIAGHGRLAAARQLGLQEIPAIRISGLSEADRRALVISDNKIALNAGWEERTLAEELRAIRFAMDSGDLDIDLQVLGFNDVELAELDRILDEPVDMDETPKDIAVTEEPAVAKTGETWILGAHRLTVGGAEAARDVDAVIRFWERETKMDARLSGAETTFKARSTDLGVEFVRPPAKAQRARRKA
jgi:hypothetical protein